MYNRMTTKQNNNNVRNTFHALNVEKMATQDHTVQTRALCIVLRQIVAKPQQIGTSKYGKLSREKKKMRQKGRKNKGGKQQTQIR